MDAIPDGRDMTGCCGAAESIAKALGGRKVGSSWMVRSPCPGHDDRDASLSIRGADDGKVLFRCHAGCSQNQVIAALRARGLWYDNGHCQNRFIRPRQRRVAKGKPDSDDATRTRMALRIMQTTAPASGTLAEAYLLWRGVHLPVPATICFHAGLKHTTGGTWPAMVGSRIAQFVAVEVKAGTNKPNKDQRDFLRIVDGAGGRAIVAYSVEDAERGLE